MRNDSAEFKIYKDAQFIYATIPTTASKRKFNTHVNIIAISIAIMIFICQ